MRQLHNFAATMESERDSDSWISVPGRQADNVISLGGSISGSSADSSNDTTDPTQDVVLQNVPPPHLGTSTSHQDEDEIENDGAGGGNSSAFVMPIARPLSVDYDEEVPPASGASGIGTQRRRKGHQQQQDEANQQQPQQQPAQPPQPPSRTHARRRTAQNSILTNPLYMFGTLTAVAYLMRPNSTEISSVPPDTSSASSYLSSKFYDNPWDQGEEFRDRSPIPEELKRKQARAKKAAAAAAAAAAAKQKKMEEEEEEEGGEEEEEEEEARRKNATSAEGMNATSVPANEGINMTSVPAWNATSTSSEARANITNVTIVAEADPFPQLYDWQTWASDLVNETTADSTFADPIFLWFAPQSGGGAFVKILQDCYDDINVTRGQWWRKHLSASNDPTLNSVDGNSHTEDGQFPIMATTNLLEAASSAYDSSAKPGRCISLFMHPIERAIRSYHWHRTVPSRVIRGPNGTSSRANTSNSTLEGYAQGPFAEENRLVRSITDRNSDEVVRWEDLEVAMDFVSRKCLVGIIGDKRSLLIRTVALIEFALGLNKREHSKYSARCTAERIDEWVEQMHNISTQRIDLPSKDARAWEALMRKNAYDMKLYERVTELFANQTRVALLNETRDTSTSSEDINSTALTEVSRNDDNEEVGLIADVNATNVRQSESYDINDDDDIELDEEGDTDDEIESDEEGETDDEIESDEEGGADDDDQDQNEAEDEENIDNEDETLQE